MFDKLEDLLVRLEEILSELNEPGVANDPARFQKLMKEQSELQPIVDAYKEYKACQQTVEESLMMLDEESDEEMREMLKEELADAKSRIEELETELKILLLPKDPNDSKNVIVEIRAGAGGDEAALFAAEIYRMYVKYAESRRWKTELMSLNDNGIGGFNFYDQWCRSIFPSEVRKWCAPCTACTGDRVRWTYPYFYDYCSNHAGSRRN